MASHYRRRKPYPTHGEAFDSSDDGVHVPVINTHRSFGDKANQLYDFWKE